MSQNRFAPGLAADGPSGELAVPFEQAGEAVRKHIRLFSIDTLRHEFRDHLPIWFVYASAIGLLHALLANYPEQEFQRLGISRAAFVPTLFFSLSWFVAYFVLRIRRSARLRARWKAYVGLVLLAVVAPIAVFLGYQPYELSHNQLTLLYESSQFVWVGLFVTQILWTRGWSALVTFFGVTFVYGLILENTGIVMGFFFEPSFRLYLGPLPAPLCTMFGWAVVFYVVVAVTDQLAVWLPALGRSVWARAAVATAMALCFDAQLDPLASMSGVFWRWNELLPPAFLGVPFINFAAWFGAVLPFAYFLFKIRDRKDLSPGQRNWELLLRVPLACLVGGLICFGVMALWEGGFSGPSFEILDGFFARLSPY